MARAHTTANTTSLPLGLALALFIAFAGTALVPVLVVCLWTGQTAAVGVGAAMLAAALASAVVARQWSLAIDQVAAAMRRLASGDCDARVGLLPAPAPLELAALGRSFDAMAEAVGRRKADLAAAGMRAQADSRDKSLFLANMSHELRTPLNAIIGFSEIMQHQLYGPIANGKYMACVGDIHASGQHLLTVINQVLDLAKVESGRMEVHYETVRLADVVEQSVRMVRPRASAKSVTVEFDAPAELPAIESDELKLRQILINLLSNAVKFTPPGGAVCITAGCEGDTAWLRVRDTGIGIAASDHARVLEPFRQAANPLGRPSEGTGLGLPLAKRMAELLGGTLTLSSSVGMGTKVEIAVPRARPGVAAPRQAA